MSRANRLSPLLVIFWLAGWTRGQAGPEAGAGTGKAEDWWSLQPLARPAAPDLHSPWIRTPVDAFILKTLQEKGLSPAPEADRRALIRRLTFDLHGLPAAPEEIDAFVNDPSAEAYEKLVDRLLASPRYGERWTRHWLDVAHYGETHGYDKDKRRPNAWPYRDYVIRALNADKPYARFVEEQIAGDFLFPDDPDGLVATGFIAAGPWDFVGHVELREGTVDKDIARSNDRDDMVSTCMSTFVSLTVHCARCHDHKFDPITMEDYYSLQAVFAGVDRADRPYDPDRETHRLRGILTREKERLEAEEKEMRAALAKTTSPEIRALDARLQELERQAAALPGLEESEGSSTLGYHSAIMPSPDHAKWVQVDLGRAVPIDSIYLLPAHVAYGGHPGPGFGFPPRFRVELGDDPEFKTCALAADHTGADFPSPGDAPYGIEARGKTARYVRVTATRLWERTEDWIFALSELVVLTGGENAALGKTVTALDSIEAPPGWARANFVDGKTSLHRLAKGTELAGRLEPWRRLEKEIQDSRRERRELFERQIDPAARSRLDALAAGLAAVKDRLAALPPRSMVYAAANNFERSGSFIPAATPRPIHLLPRGDVKHPGKEMSPGTLACVPGLEPRFRLENPMEEGSRRAALARWIASPKNPLTWRSIANRIWQHHFGQGIVDTPNDFGRMGSPPTHPELLDWLAVEFLECGGSLKKLHRLLLTSSAYRQSSKSHPAYAAIDAGNQFLWRMNRLRLDAESVRDAVLAASGRLDLAMGGPSVDHFYFKDDHSPIYDYTRFDADSSPSYRRSIYRFIVRSVPDPFMECMDCADPSLLTPKRNITLTALQALALLNNPLLVTQAEHFAERARSQAGELAGQISASYRLALGRLPEENEAAALVDYAKKYGLANACRLILNSNEFLFID